MTATDIRTALDLVAFLIFIGVGTLAYSFFIWLYLLVPQSFFIWMMNLSRKINRFFMLGLLMIGTLSMILAAIGYGYLSIRYPELMNI